MQLQTRHPMLGDRSARIRLEAREHNVNEPEADEEDDGGHLGVLGAAQLVAEDGAAQYDRAEADERARGEDADLRGCRGVDGCRSEAAEPARGEEGGRRGMLRVRIGGGKVCISH